MAQTNKKYYCVWGEENEILALTSDYGIALDVLAEHMLIRGRLTDDQWAESTAIIEDFPEFPSDNRFILDFITKDETLNWKNGETVII